MLFIKYINGVYFSFSLCKILCNSGLKYISRSPPAPDYPAAGYACVFALQAKAEKNILKADIFPLPKKNRLQKLDIINHGLVF